MDTRVNPYAVIFSLFGGYILPRGEEIWTGSLIQALATLSFSERMVRTTISRMKQMGYLESRRVGRRSFYRLTDLGLNEVRGGSDRAFASSDAEWDGKWTMVTYSIPEEHRELRGDLRASLKAIGFGSLMPGAWIYPRPLPPDVRQKWQRIGAWSYLETFRVEHMGPSDVRDLVSHAWPQLATLADRYRAYRNKYEPLLERFERENLGNEECFALRFQSLFEFIFIILEDPALPSALLPEDWPRPAAQSVYMEVRRALAEPAEHFFDGIYETTTTLGG